MKLFGRTLEADPFNSLAYLNKAKLVWELTQRDVYYRVEENLVSTVESSESFRFKALVSSTEGPVRFSVTGKGNTLEEAESDLQDNSDVFYSLSKWFTPPKEDLLPLKMMGRTLTGARSNNHTTYAFDEGEGDKLLKWRVAETYPPHEVKGDWYYATCHAGEHQVYAEGSTPEEAIAKFERELVDKVSALQSMFSQNGLTEPQGLIHD